RPRLAPCIVLDLVAVDLADPEIVALRMAEIETADRSAGPHGEALGQPHADARLGVEQAEQGRLLGVIGLCRIPGRRTNAAVFLRVRVGGRAPRVGPIPPLSLAPPLLRARGSPPRGGGGERFAHDRRLFVVSAFVAFRALAPAAPRRDGEGADIIRHAALT